MNYQFATHVLPLVFTALTTGGLAISLWRKRSIRGAITLILLLVMVTEWVVTYSLELLGADLATKLFWAKFQYFGIAFLPLAWVHFAMQFTGQRQEQSQYHWLQEFLLVVPLLVLVMIWTPALNKLIWAEIQLVQSGPFLVMNVAYGPGFWFFVVYAYGLFFYGSYQLLKTAIHTHHTYRTQAYFILIAAFSPLIGNILYLFDLSPIQGLDVSVYGFAISGLALVWAITQQQMLDLLPIARTIIVENMRSAVIVLDQDERVVDYNQAALEMLGNPELKLLGQSFANVMAEWPIFRGKLPDDAVDYVVQDTINRGDSGIDRWFDLRISRLFDSDGKSIGYLLMANETIDMIRTQKALQRRVQELVVLHAIASAGIEITNEDVLIEKATQLISQSLYPDSFGVLLLDKSEKVLRMHSSYNVSGQAKNKVIPLGEGVTGRVALTGKKLYVPNVDNEPAYICGEKRIRSELCVPMMTKGNLIGVVNVESAELDAFDQFDENLLSTFASQLAVAIERARLFKQTQQLAITDELTGLNNRRHFFDLARKEFHRARRYERHLSAIMLDFDKFKEINDTFGHAIGDNVLRAVVRTFCDNIRDVDIIGRYGGEEFVIILPETDLSSARLVAERLRKCVAEQSIKTTDGSLSVTISLGVADLTEDVETVGDLLDQADQALLRAKQSGRNQVKLFNQLASLFLLKICSDCLQLIIQTKNHV